MQWTNDPVTAGFTSAAQPWQRLADDGLDFSVAAQTDDPDSLLSHYRALIHLRNGHAALRSGSYEPIRSASRRVYAVLRQSADETLLVLVNLDRNPVTDYALTMNVGPLAGDIQVEALYGVPVDAALAPLTINAEGGFDAYQPLPQLGARQTVIVRLG
jgi:glycosidase